jgi:transposase
MEEKCGCWCGLEVTREAISVCLVGGADKHLLKFGTSEEDCRTLSAWLRDRGCQCVALVPTDPNWKSVYAALKKDFAIRIVDEQMIQLVSRRATLCEWIAELLEAGRLEKSDQVEPIGDRTAHTSEDALGGQPGQRPEHSGEPEE